jgi:hypothetical protein
VQANGSITVANRLNVLGSVSAGGDINAGTVAATTVQTPGNINAGAGGISRFRAFTFNPPDLLHTLSAATINSVGGIDFSGVAAEGDVSFATRGGRLTLNATNAITFDVEGNILGPVTLNGGDGSTVFAPGNGGTLIVNSDAAITVNTDIEASSGRIQPGQNPAGSGGAVELNSTGDAVTVTSRVEVSSAEPSSTIAPRRRSAVGGNIAVRSGRAGTAQARAVAIDIRDSGQLNSLLAAAPAPGNGGQIVIRATGANSDVNVHGKVRATGGTVDIRHTGSGGQINVGRVAGATAPAMEVRGDVVKVAALGANGVLRIGGGTISADSTMQLYAPASNGEVQFIANVSLSGNSTKSIAGHAVTIFNGVQVNVTGPAANVFVNSNVQGVPNANYTGFGGNGSTTGTFTGSGATAPQPLGNAPPLGAAPGGGN